MWLIPPSTSSPSAPASADSTSGWEGWSVLEVSRGSVGGFYATWDDGAAWCWEFWDECPIAAVAGVMEKVAGETK